MPEASTSIAEKLILALSSIKNTDTHHRKEFQNFSHADFLLIYEKFFQSYPLFDSSMPSSPYTNWSFFGVNCKFRCKCKTSHWQYSFDDQEWLLGPDFLDFISDQHHQIFDQNYTTKEPFPAGFVGYFSYDYPFNDIKLSPQKPHPFDQAYFLFFEATLNYHHETKTLIVNSPNKQVFDELLGLLENTEPIAPKSYEIGQINQLTTPESYHQNVQLVLDHIAKGDIYQANFTHKFEANFKGDSFALYKNLRAFNPAPFSCYFPLNEKQAILSSSPERFFKVQKNQITCYPIKGTIKRDLDQLVDLENKNKLLNSSKDHAELAMIVDLIRNDLGRICRFKSIKVNEWKKLETYQKVHHLVGIIEGTLTDNFDFSTIFKSLCPGGSITGAPKIKSMQILSSLEQEQRGPYTGTLGYISLNGNMDFNILIRTIILDQQNLSLQVGGGIVSDSDVASEYQESLDKAEALFDTLRPPIPKNNP